MLDEATRIPALTLFQPWAWAIVEGHKPIENRCWTTTYRGPFWVHAGKKWDEDGAEWIRDCFGLEIPEFGMAQGAIVGVANLVDITDDEYEADPWAFRGSYHWRLEGAVALEAPIPMRGKLQLWWPDDPSGIVRQLTHAERVQIAKMVPTREREDR